MKFLRRYLDEKEPTLKNFAKVVAQARGARLPQNEAPLGLEAERASHLAAHLPSPDLQREHAEQRRGTVVRARSTSSLELQMPSRRR